MLSCLAHTFVYQLHSMHTLFPLRKFVEPFDEFTVKESQQIFYLDRITHCIVDHSEYLISIETSDVPPD
jgi:hypothetical protein